MNPSKEYYRVMMGKGSIYAEECFKGKFIGGDWLIEIDLTDRLPEDWREFNRQFIPLYLERHPDKGKVAAGLACGMLHTICKGVRIGDVVLCPDGGGSYHVGTVVSDYQYIPGGILPHRRTVEWLSEKVSREDMSDALRASTGSAGTVSNITKHSREIEQLISGTKLLGIDESVEDVTVFALEKHLEDFLVHNWACTDLGKGYDIFEVDGEIVGQQYPSDTGPIDILAVSKDKKELLVVELKRGRASDAVVGQIQRYMGYVQDELTEPGQTVRGIIIAMEDDLRIRRALSVARDISFYRYEVSFKLIMS